MSGDQGKWVEGPLLPTLPPPPPERIEVRGARLVRVFSPPGTVKVDGGREAVALARAQLPDGSWAVLLAWAGHWAYEDPPHQTEAARWAWCRYDPERVKPHRPPRVLYEGACWHGWHADSQLNVAVREAVASLPEHLRETAIQPAEGNGEKPGEA
jgi:hypothetical protein